MASLGTRGRGSAGEGDTPLLLVGESSLGGARHEEGVGVRERVESVGVQVFHDLFIRRGELQPGIAEHGVKVLSMTGIILWEKSGRPCHARSREPSRTLAGDPINFDCLLPV